MKKIVFLFSLFVWFAVFPGCIKNADRDIDKSPEIIRSPKINRYQDARLSITREMSIRVALIIYTDKKPDWEDIFGRVQSDSSIYDHRIKGNPVWKLNNQYEAQLNPGAFAALKEAVRIAEISGGAFDPTILPLTTLWQIDGGMVLPDRRKVLRAREHVDYRNIVFKTGRIVSIPNGTGIDLGGIAKGAIVDSLAKYLKSLGYEDFLIEAGGDILVSGVKPGNKLWRIIVRHPRNDEKKLAVLDVGEAGKLFSVVTSGDYERYIIVDDMRYHHLLDPSTGYPASENVSVTVIAGSCMQADALSTAAFVAGYKEGHALLDGLEGVEGLLVKEDNGRLKTRSTSGFRASSLTP